MLAEASFPRGGTLKKVKPESEKETKDLVSCGVFNQTNRKNINLTSFIKQKYGSRTDHTEKKIKLSKKQRKAAKIKASEEKSEELTSISADILNRFVR